jgi:hypothetical protein
MTFSRVTESKQFQCPDCGVLPSQECDPRKIDDANWVHGGRTRLLDRIATDPYVRSMIAQQQAAMR